MKRIVIEILVGLMFCSCNSWLDVKPKLEIGQKELYDTENGFKDALSGCYALLKSDDLYGKNMTMTTLEYMAQHWIAGGSQQALRDLSYKDEINKGIFKSVYNKFYNAIAQANDLIAHLDKQGKEVIDDVKMVQRIKGEAVAIRAYCHFDLLRLFGQIPQAKGEINVSLPYAEVASEERVPAYDFDAYTEKLLEDILEAETLLEMSDPIMEYTFEELNDPVSLWGANAGTDDAFRRVQFNYWAVKALEARYYLYVGNKLDAYQTANEILVAKVNGKKIAELSCAGDIANKAYTLPSETLLALHVYDLQKKDESLFDGTNALSAADTKDLVLSEVFKNQSSDLRFGLFEEQLVSSKTRMVLKKYRQDDSGLGLEGNRSVTASDNYVTMQMVPLIRLAEIYLIAAETAPNITEANRIMRELKQDRGVLHQDYASRSEWEADVLSQYHREFWGEGQVFFMYKRKMSDSMLWRYKPVTEENYIVPLPDGEY